MRHYYASGSYAIEAGVPTGKVVHGLHKFQGGVMAQPACLFTSNLVLVARRRRGLLRQTLPAFNGGNNCRDVRPSEGLWCLTMLDSGGQPVNAATSLANSNDCGS
jgi:hypothetical protein